MAEIPQHARNDSDAASRTPDAPITSRERLWQWVALLGSALAVLALDQGAKAWVLSRLRFGESWAPIAALSDFLTVTLSKNTGAAFSIFPQAGNLFLIISLVMIIGIPLFYRRIPRGHWADRIALGILLGGISGNVLDRLRFDFVVDFFHIQIRPWLSNVSNFADHAIVLGIAILFVTQWNSGKKPASETTQHNPPQT